MAALIAGVIALSYVHGFVYTRIEGTKLETSVSENALKIDSIDRKYDAKMDLIQRSLIEIQKDLGRLIGQGNRDYSSRFYGKSADRTDGVSRRE
jgi:hypothetical protein